MQIKTFLPLFESFAPLSLAEPWDKVGLQVGSPDADFTRILLTIDLTQSVAEEAVAKKAGLLLAYHPVIFEPLKSLTDQDPKTRAILTLIRHGINVFSPHTALDACHGGINDWLAQGLADIPFENFHKHNITCPPIKPTPRDNSLFKVIVFIPAENLESVRNAMAAAGAGQLGNYSKCSFETRGTGTFQGNSSSNPAIGKPNTFERVDEIRLEMIASAPVLAPVIQAMRQSHPYEEPAFDVFRQESIATQKTPSTVGQGRILHLPKPVTLAQLIPRIKSHLNVDHLQITPAKSTKKIQRIALCAGAGASLLKDAGDIDLFLTGEMRHHDQLDAASRNITVILAGHTQTERGYLKPLQSKLNQILHGRAVQTLISRQDQPPTHTL